MLLPEQMGWTFHRVCIKEASTWMLPLEMDKCCGGNGINKGSVYFPQRSSGQDAGNCSTFQVTLFILKDVLIGPGQLQTPLFFIQGCIGATDCCLQASQTGLSNCKPCKMIVNLKKSNFKDALFLCMAMFCFCLSDKSGGRTSPSTLE